MRYSFDDIKNAPIFRMRFFIDGIEKNLILRKPRSGCLEGRTG
jgi:hypothetical protein